MKKLVLFGVVLSLAFGTRAQGNDDSYTFEYETLPSGDVRISHNLKPSLTERGDRAQGTVFNVVYKSNFNVSQRRAIEYAAKLWEEQLRACYPKINLHVSQESLNSLLGKTKVLYYRDQYHELMSGALLKSWQITAPEFLSNIENFSAFEQGADIAVTFNSNMMDSFYWGTDGNTPADQYDAVTFMIREIAKGLEFSTTLMKRGNTYYIGQQGKLNILDKKLGFSDYTSGSSELANKIAAGDITLTLYLEHPLVFRADKLFKAVTDESAAQNGAMFLTAELPKGSSYHEIGESICHFMDFGLNWLPPIPVGDESRPAESTSTDLVGYNTDYTFSNQTYRRVAVETDSVVAGLRSEVVPLFDYIQPDEGKNFDGELGLDEWRLDMLRADGKYIPLKSLSGYSPTFTINSIDIPTDVVWARNADGYLRGRIYYKDPFEEPPRYRFEYIYLDYLPEEPELEAVTQEPRTRSSIPELMLAFKAFGAETVRVVHENEDGEVSYDFDPDIELIDMRHVDPFIENRFTLTAINKHGQKMSKTVTWGGYEFLRQYNQRIRSLHSAATSESLRLTLIKKNTLGDDLSDGASAGTIVDYRISSLIGGIPVLFGYADTHNIEVPIGDIPRGAYIVRVTDETGNVYTSKFIK